MEVMDPARAFALVSVAFYGVFVAGLHRLTLGTFGERAALLAGLYAAFAPVSVTRYSLNNDGTYVEVLALGVWALWLLARWTDEPGPTSLLALAAGLLLGVAFWCHIFAVIHLAAAALAIVLLGGPRALRSLVALVSGWALGAAPALLWNAANGWVSFEYFVPGKARGIEGGATALLGGLGAKVAAMVTGDWPVLMGYDQGYGPAVDKLMLAFGWLGVAAACVGVGGAARAAVKERSRPLAVLLLFVALTLAVVAVALSHVPGNPRYLLGLMAILPAFIAAAFGEGRRRLVLFVLVAGSAVASLVNLPGSARADARWREFVAELEAEPVQLLLHRLPPRHADQLPVGREGHLLGKARPRHHRILPRLPFACRGGAIRSVHSRQPDGRGPTREASRRSGRGPQAARLDEAGSAALPQGGSE